MQPKSKEHLGPLEDRHEEQVAEFFEMETNYFMKALLFIFKLLLESIFKYPTFFIKKPPDGETITKQKEIFNIYLLMIIFSNLLERLPFI